uniref:Uncharacterized protein n=1 Tax=Aegilops tauschii TaxID=37682 RepID=M8CVM1_AEGTA
MEEEAPKSPTSVGAGDQQVPPGAGGGEEHGGLDDLDLMSHLPDEVLGTVISLLPTRDGARTQLLSRRWRPLWLSSNAPLNLGADFALRGEECTLCGATHECMHKRIAFVSKILSDHPGPTRRFALHLVYWPNIPGVVDGWFRSRSLSGLQDLEVANKRSGYVLLPSHALIRFAPTLCLLSLSQCQFPDLGAPPSFPHLKELIIVSLHNMECGRVCINSPTIRSISFYGRWRSVITFQELVIEDAPSLERLVPLDPDCGPATIRIIQAPKLKILGLLSGGISTLRIGTTVFQKMVAVSLITKMHTVKILLLDSIGPNLDSVVNFLKCFPCLEKLYVIVSHPERDSFFYPELHSEKDINNVREYDPLDPIECLELNLKKVVLKNYDGIKRAIINFAKFFILNAKVLEEMEIGVLGHGNDKRMQYLHEELQVENRASQDAQIELKRDVDQPIIKGPFCAIKSLFVIFDEWSLMLMRELVSRKLDAVGSFLGKRGDKVTGQEF